MCTIALMSYNFGILIVLGCGLVLPWRTVAFICAVFPLSCLFAVLFVSANQNDDCEFFFKQVCKVVCLKFKNCSICRCQNHRHGCCCVTEPKTLKNHCNGYVDGHQRRRSTKNFLICKIIVVHRPHVWHVQSNRLNVNTRNQHIAISSTISSESER